MEASDTDKCFFSSSYSSFFGWCRDKTEEQLSVSTRKKVTFDSNVKTYEPVLQDEVVDSPPENRKSEEEGGGGKEGALAKPNHISNSSSSEDSSVTSTGSYPPNHRYQNCRDSDDEEEEELDYCASDLSDEEEECDELGEDFGEDDGIAYSTSRATIAADHVFAEEVESPIPIHSCESERDVIVKSIVGSNPNARDRSVYVHPVLNPVENLTQWKVVKAKRTPPLRPQKENCSMIASETDTPKRLNQEIPVDASLSNWLASPSSEKTTTPVNLYAGTPDRSPTSQGTSNSVISHEDRPILGALTVEELKKFSATSSSPRKSPSRSPDDMPIIGTVGTYWNFTGSAEGAGSASSFKGIPNTTSKYREVKMK